MDEINSKGSTSDNLQSQIDALFEEVQSLSSQLGFSNPSIGHRFKSDIFEGENDRIEKYLSDFTHREGVLLTVAGLFSLLPLVDAEQVLPYFLAWVVPFLLVAIFTYVCSSKRINVVSRADSSHEPEPLNSKLLNDLLKKQYFSSMRFHKITDVALVSFFTSFVTNYYLIVFIGLPNLPTSISLILLSILVGYARYYYVSKLKGAEVSEPFILGGIGVPGLPIHVSPKPSKKVD